MSDVIPTGYFVLRFDGDVLLLAASMPERGKLSPANVTYKGHTYQREQLDVVPLHLASDVCSVRRYTRVSDA